MTASLRFALLLFPRLTQLDLTGPYEVFARVPGGLPDTTFAAAMRAEREARMARVAARLS